MELFKGNRRESNIEFEEAFSSLKRMENIVPSAKRTLELLAKLNSETTNSEADVLIDEFHKIQYGSNTNNVFYFYLPIVSHILYYKPQYEKELLKYLVGPNFANGTSETNEMIEIIISAMNYKLSQNQYYLTKESQHWIINELPKLQKEVEREIQVCWKELNE
ncbi:hypothetical protein [Flavobacterium johnsoniae]|uniref:Uncharacterized protein n=1 Tax=Flavobacterium johnsoniae TaxID=986 RepID=A0A1J7BUR8_FLAJO|nr:hypothetical protein [Flavobacterium johnsoniae]OIV42325.1 hypothetical protein BKM63_05455 [Flavobacterium johnsoniae]